MPTPAFPTQPPPFSFATEPVASADPVSLVVVPVVEDVAGPRLENAAGVIATTGVDLRRVLEQEEYSSAARLGSVNLVPILEAPAQWPDLRTIALLGVEEGTPAQWRSAMASLVRVVRGHHGVLVLAEGALDDQVTALVEGVVLGGFEFSSRQESGPALPLKYWIELGAGESLDPDLIPAALIGATAAWQARRLATMPSNIKSPKWLAGEVRRLLDGQPIRVTEFDYEKLQADGFGGITAVGQGSATPPRLLQLEYQPKSPKQLRDQHVVLVGKGITFDTGGLSIKPADSMANMKRDMTGAAVVAAVMTALAGLGCQIRVTAVLPMAENSVSGSAARPGDVITHYGGRTTEITNTDAEGRLVLADALAYAIKELRPSRILDIATLTGGAKVALGTRIGALFASTDDLATELLAAAESAGEPLWRLPLSAEYDAKLSSPVADAVNSSGGPPAITAALFLKHFVAGTEWAHLDIAGVGDAEDDRHEWTKGPTGFGTRTLLRWLSQLETVSTQPS